MENFHLSIHMASWKESMINRLSNLINRNRSAAKISQVLCSNPDAQKSSCLDFNFKASLRIMTSTISHPLPTLSLKRKVHSINNLLRRLNVNKGGVAGGQAGEGVRVQVGDDLLQRQESQGCQTHVELAHRYATFLCSYLGMLR